MKVYNAWQAFRRGKKPSRLIDAFAYNLEAELGALRHEIARGTYLHGPYQVMVVQEKKRRQLAVASVRDRVVHRLVYDQLVGLFDSTFDPDVWSCRQGRGLYGCLRRTKHLIGKYPSSYIWRMDITKFFDDVDHLILRQCVRRRLIDQEILHLCDEIVDSYRCPGRESGIPIGNLTSQIFANIYLNEFDRFIRHELKPIAYVRYGDDVVVWCRTRRQAEAMRRRAKIFLSRQLYLTVNPKNDVIVSAQSGLHFLGHVVTSTYVVVDRHTTRLALAKSNGQSIASYKALLLAKVPRQQLDWLLADELGDIVP